MAKHKGLQSKKFETKSQDTIETNVDSKRILSNVIDWFLGGIISGLPGVVCFAWLTGSGELLTSMYQFESAGFSRYITLIVSLSCLLFGFCYYVIVPWKVWPGQTVGKRLAHLKIIRYDQKSITFGTYFIRQFIILMFVEGAGTATSTYIKILLTTSLRFYVDGYLAAIWNVMTLVSIGLLFWSRRHLAIHDYVCKTTVVSAKTMEKLVDRGAY